MTCGCSGHTAADRAIQLTTNSPVNHVGMSVVLDDLPALMWHAELGRSLPDLWSGSRHRGVQLHDLRAAVPLCSSTRLFPENIWLIERTQPRTTRGLRSAPITRASALLRAGPPARPAPVLSPSRHQHRLGTSLSPARSNSRAVSGHAFSCSARKPQTGLASSTCRTPPGQSADIRQAHPRGSQNTPVSMSAEWVSTRQQRFARARLPRSPPDASHDAFSSSLTTTVFSQRSMRRFEASLRRDSEGPRSFISHAASHQGPVLHRPFLAFRTHLGTQRQDREVRSPNPAALAPRLVRRRIPLDAASPTTPPSR